MRQGAVPWSLRARAWALMRAREMFTAGEIFYAVGMRRSNFYEFLLGLRQAGWVTMCGHRRGPQASTGHVWQVRTDAPRQLTMTNYREIHQATIAPRQQAWNSMRIFQVFTLADILRTANIGVGTLRHYVHALGHAGYLRKEAFTRSKRTRGQRRFRLLHNTGPHAPMVTDRGWQVYCPNWQVYCPATPRPRHARAIPV